jgi:hypothetical protein
MSVRNFGLFLFHERFQSSATSYHETGLLPSSGLSVQELCFLVFCLSVNSDLLKPRLLLILP